MLVNAAEGWDLAVDATHVYWATPQGGVWKAPKAGGEAEELFGGPPGYANGESAIALYGDDVYWVSGVDSAVRSVPKSGGAAVVLASDPGILWTIAANDTGVYWGYINGDARIMRLAPGAATPTLVAKPVNPSKIAVNESHVYFGDMSATKLMRAPIAGGSANTLASSVHSYKVVIDATAIYWTTGDPTSDVMGDGRVYREPLTGGKPTVLVDGLDWPTGIATDAQHVYFTDSVSGKIMRVPLEGGTAVALAEQQYTPWALALDDKAVYYTTQNGILKLAK
jgi:sugar lactone lactonase YvrE